MVFNATFTNISLTSWWSVLMVEDTRENHRPATSIWQTLSQKVVSSSVVPHMYPLSFISFSMVRLHVVFGLPLFLFPSGVHLSATFVMSSDGLRRTWPIRVITNLPNSEQSYKGKVKTHNYINRQNQSTTGKLWKP